MHNEYNALVAQVLASHRVSSRYGGTREVLGGLVTGRLGEFPVRKKMSPAIGFVELLQLVSGRFDLDSYRRVVSEEWVSAFTEFGAYGPRARRQLDTVIANFITDLGSRQHVVFLGRPGDQGTPDAPCTVALQFLVRDAKLNVIAMMRSSDVTRGLPYDIMQFGGLGLLIARVVGVSEGSLTVFAGSSHVYDRDVINADASMTGRFVCDDTVPRTWPELQDWAVDELAFAPWRETHGLPRGLRRVE